MRFQTPARDDALRGKPPIMMSAHPSRRDSGTRLDPWGQSAPRAKVSRGGHTEARA